MDGRIVLVRRSVRPRARNRTAWLVGALAMTEAVFQAGEAGLAGHSLAGYWWLLGGGFMLALSMRVEAFKQKGRP